MDKELLKCLVAYYAQVEKVDTKWAELNNNIKLPLYGLRNQAEQLRAVMSDDVGNLEIFQFEGVKEKLIFKICLGIEDEVAFIQETVSLANNANQDLKNKLIQLENIRSKVSVKDDVLKELIMGTPHRPRLNLLLEWAIDGYDYYHKLYCKIKECLAVLDYRKEDTIEQLERSFKQTRIQRIKIDRILAHTQFLTKEFASACIKVTSE